jgi:type I restriction enzyme, S subunit
MISATSSSQWKYVPLGSIGKFRNGINYNKSNFGTGIKVVNVKDFQDRIIIPVRDLDEINPTGVISKESVLKNGDIIFVRSNGNRQLIGRSLFVNNLQEKITHSAFTIRVRFTSDLAFPRFYSYLFRSSIMRQIFSSQGSGTNINNLNQRILEELQVPLPPIPTQRKIAAILSAYDDLIENNTRRIKILEEMAQTLYREWFVYFRFPGHEKVPMVDSPLGDIPEGWEIKTLGETCQIVMGQSPKSEFYNEVGDGLPFHQGVTDFGSRFPTDRVYCTVQNRIAGAGDILFSVRAPVGRINIADKRIVIGRGLSAIRSKNGHQIFVFQQLNEKFQEEDSMGGGTIFKSVTKDEMNNIDMIEPCGAFLKEFQNIVGPMCLQLDNLVNRNGNLRRTRDLLLPKLLSGEIDIDVLELVKDIFKS